MTRNALYDRIAGVWSGKSIGGNAGAPIEGDKNTRTFRTLRDLSREVLPNDDLDIQIVWLEVFLKNRGVITPRVLGEGWLEHVHFPWSEYKAARRNLQRGLFPPLSGIVDNHAFGESMGCPIRSEIWACLAWQDTQLAADFARMDGSIDHYGFSVEIEGFLAALLATVLKTPAPDAVDLVTGGLEGLLTRTAALLGGDLPDYVATCIRLAAKPTDTAQLQREIFAAFPSNDGMDARINVAIVLAALVRGRGDFERTLVEALNLGYDCDCTAATSCALIGGAWGYARLKREYGDLISENIVLSPQVKNIAPPRDIFELTERTLRALAFSGASTPVVAPAGATLHLPSWRWQCFGPLVDYPPRGLKAESLADDGLGNHASIPFDHGPQSTIPSFSHILGTRLPATSALESVPTLQSLPGATVGSLGNLVPLPPSWVRLKGAARVGLGRTLALPAGRSLYVMVRGATLAALLVGGRSVPVHRGATPGVPFENIAVLPPLQVDAGGVDAFFVLDFPGGFKGGALSPRGSAFVEIELVENDGSHPQQNFAYVEPCDRTVEIGVQDYLRLV